MPSVRCRYDGLAAAHRPNAPSTCTHASYVRATGIAAAKSSNAPECTSPAWRQTIAGPSPPASTRPRSATSIRPWSSVSTSTTES